MIGPFASEATYLWCPPDPFAWLFPVPLCPSMRKPFLRMHFLQGSMSPRNSDDRTPIDIRPAHDLWGIAILAGTLGCQPSTVVMMQPAFQRNPRILATRTAAQSAQLSASGPSDLCLLVPDKERKEEKLVARKRTAHGLTASSRNLCKETLTDSN